MALENYIMYDSLVLMQKPFKQSYKPLSEQETYNRTKLSQDSFSASTCNRPCSKSIETNYSVCNVDDLTYRVENGFLVAINFVNFDGSCVPRPTAHKDAEEFIEFFNGCNFSTESFTDCTRDKVITECCRIVSNEKIQGYDCIAVLISSHGNETGIICSDNEVISINEIIEIFCGKQSRIKVQTPKLFFIQACRGTEIDEGKVPTRNFPVPLSHDTGTKLLLPYTNTLVAHSTTENKKAFSYRNHPHKKYNQTNTVGSWFIACLFSIFKEHSEKEDLLTMLTRVNKAMCLYGNDEKMKQISSQENQLTYIVYLTKRYH